MRVGGTLRETGVPQHTWMRMSFSSVCTETHILFEGEVML